MEDVERGEKTGAIVIDDVLIVECSHKNIFGEAEKKEVKCYSDHNHDIEIYGDCSYCHGEEKD